MPKQQVVRSCRRDGGMCNRRRRNGLYGPPGSGRLATSHMSIVRTWTVSPIVRRTDRRWSPCQERDRRNCISSSSLPQLRQELPLALFRSRRRTSSLQGSPTRNSRTSWLSPSLNHSRWLKDDSRSQGVGAQARPEDVITPDRRMSSAIYGQTGIRRFSQSRLA